MANNTKTELLADAPQQLQKGLAKMQGSTVSDNLPEFQEILARWIQIHREAGKLLRWSDCMWWYGERSSIGALAAAVWKSGGTALEEYTTHKGLNSRSYRGRCDLRIWHNSLKYTIEAKQIWPGIGNPSQQHANQIKNALEEADGDLRKNKPDDSVQLGVVFASPSLPDTRSVQVSEAIEAWIDTAGSVEADAKAWIFPEQARQLRADEEDKIYPGTMMLVRRFDGP
jgi:hypothetical protein